MDVLFDTSPKTATLKTGGPRKAPPVTPELNRNPKRHDIVAWRHDGAIQSWKFETKESALEHGKWLTWVVYYQWALMDGRNMVEKHSIAIPADMGLREDGLPYKI